MTLMNQAVTTPCHNAGKDLLGKLCLFSILMRPFSATHKFFSELSNVDWEMIIRVAVAKNGDTAENGEILIAISVLLAHVLGHFRLTFG